MTTANPGGSPAGRRTGSADVSGHRTRRLSTETKSALKTTEFFAYIACVVAVLIASMLVGTEEGHLDYFRADKAWLYIVILTVGYMISRGLAKSGSRDNYDDDGS
ncbi:hypothetical protein AMK16_30175 [Streptomyces sp. CB00455]|uniref:hypothetical protein n=1 Tax=Streptomyces sp. CB00455 TaxID=1703927 RepID=UPI00093BA554|nr:hypothetical protein [Streptomyces sp. CB00455]OKK14798.1 hypothetical protein AMK16_30175 [Streptomyces sp. CB00455]